VLHPCIHIPPKEVSISKIVMCSHFALGGFYSYCTPFDHATPLSHRLLTHAGICVAKMLKFFSQLCPIHQTFFVKSTASSICQSFFHQLCNKVHSPKFFTVYCQNFLPYSNVYHCGLGGILLKMSPTSCSSTTYTVIIYTCKIISTFKA